MEGRSDDASSGQRDALDLRESGGAGAIVNVTDVNIAETSTMSSQQDSHPPTVADGARFHADHNHTLIGAGNSSRTTIRTVVAALRAHGVSLLLSSDTE